MSAAACLLLPVLLASTPAPPSRVELIFGGDVIPHGEVKRSALDYTRYPPEWDASKAPKGTPPPPSLNHDGWDVLFEPIAPLLRAADVGVINLETPVTDNARAASGPFVFNAPSTMAQALAASGVRLVSTANNHALDQQRRGMLETLGQLDAAGLLHVGSGGTRELAWAPVFLDVKGVRLGFLSLTRWMNGHENPSAPEGPHVAYLSYDSPTPRGSLTVEQALERVRAAASQCEALVVMIHWGSEYARAPRPEDVKLGRSFLEAGAAAVIGHHPHVLQPLETYQTQAGRRGLIAYSLGNLLANQARFYQYTPGNDGKGGDTRDSLLLRLALVRREEGGPVELGEVAVVPLWIENNAVGRLRGQPRHIQPVLLEPALARVGERLAALQAEAAQVEAAQAAEAQQRAAAPDARALRALPLEERQAVLRRLEEDKRARAERVKLERELRRQRAELERLLAFHRLRRERIVRMVPEGIAIAPLESAAAPAPAPAPAATPQAVTPGSGGFAAQSAP